MKRVALLILVVFLAGCTAIWTKTDGTYESRSWNISVELPEGWMKQTGEKSIVVTRDGVLLQNIVIGRFSVDDEFEHTKKKLRRDMLTHEMVETIIDSVSSNPSFLNFEVLEKEPVEISGIPGFRVVHTYKTKDGLRVKGVYYGFIWGDWFYRISYSAPARYYFDKDLKTFEKVYQSFRLIKET